MPLEDALNEVEEADQVDQQRATIRRLETQLAKAKDRGEQLKQALYDGVRDAIAAQGPLPTVPLPVLAKAKGRPEIALLHTTDWQASKVTTSYNSQVLAERLVLLRKRVEKLTEIHRLDHPVDELVIACGGDMIEGLFNYPAQLAQIDATLFTQWTETSGQLAELVRWGLSRFKRVQVVAEWGNHGRIGSKRAEVPKNDNFDRMVYAHAKALLGKQPRLTWGDCPDDVQRIEIGNYRALLIHGDEFGRSGFASPMTIVRHADRWRSGAFRDTPWANGAPSWEFRDLYVGHYHTHNEWAMANGEGTVFQTGSTESDNRYARDGMSASAIPSQRLHFIDPDKGSITSQYKIPLA